MNQPLVKKGPGIPETAKYHYNFNDRHIFNDAFNKRIIIQVSHDHSGNLKYEEFQRMKSGLFWEFIPEHLLADIRACVDVGYEVVPGFVNGYNTGSGHIVYQLHPIMGDSPLFGTKK